MRVYTFDPASYSTVRPEPAGAVRVIGMFEAMAEPAASSAMAAAVNRSYIFVYKICVSKCVDLG